MQVRWQEMTDPNNPDPAAVQLSHLMHTHMPQSADTTRPTTYSDKLAGAYAEVYRGIYPYMTEKTRGMIKEFILRDPDSYNQDESRRTAATKLAKRIVEKHYANIQRPGSLLPREPFIGDVIEKELLPDRARIASALRPKTGREDLVIDPTQEAKILAKQLMAIPFVPSLLISHNPEGDLQKETQRVQRRIINSYNNWVNTAAQITLGHAR